jgi:Polyketide cyclase / dehydrase and lipid transport
MKPITFACREKLPLAPEEIAEHILDLTKWPEFRGYGPIPGIRSAEFETRTPNVVGSRIRVSNLDGSSHVEEIVEWQPNRRLQLRMGDFSKPLSRLATGFVETWEFEQVGYETRAVRSFELNAKSMLTKPLLWLISFFLKRAIARHLTEIKHAPKES